MSNFMRGKGGETDIFMALLLCFLAPLMACHSADHSADHFGAVPHVCTDWELEFEGKWYRADVPGSVHTDLMRIGVLEDPFEGVNEGEVQWVEHREWRYRTAIQRPEGLGQWALEFGGLDTYAKVILGQDTLLRTNNMHRTWRIPLAQIAACSSDTLEVWFSSPIREGQAALEKSSWPIPVSNEARPIGQQTSAVTRKAMYHYGWDWGPRLATSGIWKPVRWVRVDTEWPTHRMGLLSLSEEEAKYEVVFDEPVEGVTASLNLRGERVSHSWRRAGEDRYVLVVPEPELWWPHGMGDQPLYALTLDGGIGGPLELSLGVRSLEWDMGPDPMGHAMQCVVNGRPVQVRGANVIPPDFFPVRALKAWPRVINDAKLAHMNMLRVWGGAHYGDEELYDLCDRHGILVWQDFMSACAMVPGDEAWKANFLAEAEGQVLRLRNRPSLALWCGNNESEKAWREWGWQDLYDLHGADSVQVERAYKEVFESLLPELVKGLNGGQYWPSSPHSLEVESPRESGDQHDWGVWFGKAGFEYFSDEAGRFASEFGLQSLPDRRTLQAVGVKAFEDTVLQFRQRCKMEWLEPGFDGWDMMRHYAGEYFADPAQVHADGQDKLEDWIHLTQLTQAEGLRQAIERHRCSNGRTSGSLYWQLDDVWPTVSWSTVDHAGRWKLGHHAVRHANQPARVLWDREWDEGVRLVAQNLGPSPIEGIVDWQLLGMQGDTLNSGSQWAKVNGAALSLSNPAVDVVEVMAVAMPTEDGVLVWSWTAEDGELLDAGAATMRPASAMDWPSAKIELSPQDGGVWLQSEQLTGGVRLVSQSQGRFSDNGFILLPGERKWVGFVSQSGEAAQPESVEVMHMGDYRNQPATVPSSDH